MSIVIKELCAGYGAETVLSSFSAEIADAERVCVTGPSGSGKTTLVRVLLGLLAPRSGSVSGVNAERVSAAFQEDRLVPALTAAKNVLLVLPPRYPADRLTEAFERIGLEKEDMSKRADELSGGMARRVSLLRALLYAQENDSRFVALDEPFKGLDADTKAKVVGLINECCAGRTLLVVTHDRTDASALGARELTLAFAVQREENEVQ